MNYFIGWKFGVPVRVSAQSSSDQDAVRGEVRLIHENASTFIIVVQRGGAVVCNKQYYHYELISYRNFYSKPRYPVCVNKEKVVYCNAWGKFSDLSQALTKDLVRTPKNATLTIDGKTIELSRETIDRLKKELGV